MTVWLPVVCPDCGSDNVIKHGKSPERKQRYLCRNSDCLRCTFMLDTQQPGRKREVKQKIVDMALNGSGIRDTARALHVSPATVIRGIKKKSPQLEQVNQSLLKTIQATEVEVEIRRVEEAPEGIEEAQLDEMWSYVGNKINQRWLWHAIDRASGKVLAYVFGTRKDEVFIQLKALLQPFGISRYYTDDWGAYERHLDRSKHEAGKQNTQKIENKHLNFRTRIKRLARRTICFSKTVLMHDLVIGLFINRYEFGLST